VSGEVIRRGSRIRASDDDRELLISELREHAVAGRLTTDDLEQRVQATYQAITLGELDQLRRDLPLTPGQLALQQTARRAHLTRRLVQESGGSLGVFVLCVGIWVASGAQGQFWPVWVLIVFALSVIRNGWALYGPAPDLDAVEATLDSHRARRLERSERRSERRGR